MVKIESNQYLNRVLELIETSTIHGLPNAVRNKNKLMKTIWLSAFLGFTIYSFYSVNKIVMEYLNFEVLIKLEINQDFDIDFPSVTFCNLNPIDYSIKSNIDKTNFYINKIIGKNQSFIFENYQNHESLEYNQICSNNSFKDNLNMYINEFKGFSLDKMLVSCSYDNEPCSLQDFTIDDSFFFGNCFTFNFNKSLNKSNLKLKEPGIFNGFKLKLFVGTPELQPCWNTINGALVVIHDINSKPLYRQESIMVQTGVETNIILNKNEVFKKNKPYGNCIEDLNSKDSFNSISYKNFMKNASTYKQIHCLTTCARDKSSIENKKNCDQMNNTDEIFYRSCIRNTKNISSYYKKCSEECPVECKSHFYNKYLTHSDFLTNSYAAWLLSNKTFLSKFANMNANFESIKKSLVSINVYFGSNFVEKIIEQPKIEFIDLLGNIGGQLGLFLGISFLSFLEIFEILLEIILIKINRKINK